MAEDITLLAYLVPRLTSRGEDTATDALAFILNKSDACRGALDRLLKSDGFNPEPISAVRTQVTYEDGSRPDMIGYDRSGAKRLLVESKFWASLLQGQASDYFQQLEDSGPGTLLFIAPDSRIDTLWAEIRRQMESGDGAVQLELIESPERVRSAHVAGSDKRLMLVSWNLLLDRMASAVPNDSPVASDIQQLRGLARREDEDAFQPMRPEEFGLALPRRVRWLNHLVDDVVNAHGVPEGWMTTRRLLATPQREGYGRYFRFTDVPGSLFLCVNFYLWATSGDTPLWLWISGDVPVNVERLRERAPSLIEYEGWGTYDVPIHLKTGVEYDTVLDDVVSQVKAISNTID